MEIYRMAPSGRAVREESLAEGLKLDPGIKQTIAFAGAGGKTTAIYALAEELASLGRKVIITTTTHMYLPDRFGVLDGDKEKIIRMLEEQRIAAVGIPQGDGKMAGVEEELFAWLQDAADIVLVEADGSKGLPLKAPNETEPVIPAGTGTLVIVAGMDSLGSPLGEVCHRARLAAGILGCGLEQEVTPGYMVKLIRTGYCDNPGIPCRIILNKWDREKQSREAQEIAVHLAGYDCIFVKIERLWKKIRW